MEETSSGAITLSSPLTYRVWQLHQPKTTHTTSVQSAVLKVFPIKAVYDFELQAPAQTMHFSIEAATKKEYTTAPLLLIM